ncbi:MAG TPA: hypothetical protein VIT92_11940 [Burkholderiaceae bacterium]
MKAIETGGPAFPAENAGQSGPSTYHFEGMTLRDYFAAQALPAVIRQCYADTRSPDESQEDYFARACYAVSDAMLKARAQ